MGKMKKMEGREDINQKIILYLSKQLERANKEGLVNFEEFKKYVIELGNEEPDHLVNIPVSILNQLIDAAIETYNEKYIQERGSERVLFDRPVKTAGI